MVESKTEHSKPIGRKGRLIIYFGLPLGLSAAFFTATEPHHWLEHTVGQKIFPYVLYFIPALLIVFGAIIYDRIPQRLVVPIGIAGWAIGLGLLYWFFWFGPGAL